MSLWNLFLHSFKPGLLKLAKLRNAWGMRCTICVLAGCQFDISVSQIVASKPDRLVNGSVDEIDNISPSWSRVLCYLWTFPAGLLITSGLAAIVTVADGIGLTVDWGVIKRRNLLLCRVMRPDPFNITLYCLCRSTSMMVAVFWQQFLFFCWVSYIATIDPISSWLSICAFQSKSVLRSLFLFE